MDEINRTGGQTLGTVVPSQRPDRSLSSSERMPRAMVRNLFLQVAAEHPRACLNGMSWNPVISNQAILAGSRHLVAGDSLVRDLNEIFVSG